MQAYRCSQAVGDLRAGAAQWEHVRRIGNLRDTAVYHAA